MSAVCHVVNTGGWGIDEIKRAGISGCIAVAAVTPLAAFWDPPVTPVMHPAQWQHWALYFGAGFALLVAAAVGLTVWEGRSDRK